MDDGKTLRVHMEVSRGGEDACEYCRTMRKHGTRANINSDYSQQLGFDLRGPRTASRGGEDVPANADELREGTRAAER